MYELNPPAPPAHGGTKEGGVKFLAPLCAAERGWGEFMKLCD